MSIETVNSVPKIWVKVLKENQSDCSNLVLFDHQLLKEIRKLSTYIKLNPINIALLLQEARNRKISKTQFIEQNVIISVCMSPVYSGLCVLLRISEAIVRRCLVKKVSLKNSQENTSYQHSCFSVNFAKFVRTPFP